MEQELTRSDIERIESKLDAIIRHFGIGRKPTRSVREIDKVVDLALRRPRKKCTQKR